MKGLGLIHIKPEDTKQLDFATYKYDVQITKSNGDVFTVVGPADLKIMPEVTT